MYYNFDTTINTETKLSRINSELKDYVQSFDEKRSLDWIQNGFIVQIIDIKVTLQNDHTES